MLTYIQFNFQYLLYMEQMSEAEQSYLYEMYKHSPKQFSISRAVYDINKLRTINIPYDTLKRELAY